MQYTHKKTPTFSPTKHLLTISHTHKHRHYVSVSGGHSDSQATTINPADASVSSVWTFPKSRGRGTHCNGTQGASTRDSQDHWGKTEELHKSPLPFLCGHHFILSVCGQWVSQCHQSATYWGSLKHHRCYYGDLDFKLHLCVLLSGTLREKQHLESGLILSNTNNNL